MNLIKKNQQLILYLIVGGLTTLVNIIVYFLLREIFNINFLISVFISWLASITFAFIPNKIFVFKSKSTNFVQTFREFILFVFYRVLSLGIDMFLMAIFILIINEFYLKIIVQVVIILLNYIFSKFLIFKKGEKNV